MESSVNAELLTDQFWESEENAVCLPRHAPVSARVIGSVLRELGVAGVIVFQTSGSCGDARYVCHSRRSLLASAKAVNAHLQALASDRWCCALPSFHVGGFSIYARAYCSQSDVYDFGQEWDPASFGEHCVRHGATLSSLVPTQVYDLVEAGIPCPPSLRAVLVGGGYLDDELEARARVLAWPMVRTYGLTEAASQVATQRTDGALQLLPHVEVALAEDGRCQLRGDSLLSGYLLRDESGLWKFEDPKTTEGWFQTDDLVELDGRTLRFVGRLSSRVKVLGELVDVEALERAFLKTLPSACQVALAAVPDARSEHALVVAFAGDLDRPWIEARIDAFNASLAGFERLSRATRLPTIPRGELGKVRRGELQRMLIEAKK